jgi:hypothetical protein
MIYICGDSFACPDVEYGPNWADLLGQQLPVTNLSGVCASNLLVAQQVDQAIQQAADAIIVLFTASTRGQTQINGSIVPYSMHSLDSTTPFSKKQLEILIAYTEEFFDLDLAIYENQLIIESTLHRLVNSGISFVFDQGGFEHPSYGGQKQYFQEFNQWRSSICLWDYAPNRTHRPYYHINDLAVHQHIANYYYEYFTKT